MVKFDSRCMRESATISSGWKRELPSGNFFPYLFFGTIGYLASAKQTMKGILVIVLAFAAHEMITRARHTGAIPVDIQECE